MKQVNESRIIGSKQGSKQLQSVQRQDIYYEKLKARDAYELQNLGGFTVLYPPMTAEGQIDTLKLEYYR